jgi:hypothetical protein
MLSLPEWFHLNSTETIVILGAVVILICANNKKITKALNRYPEVSMVTTVEEEKTTEQKIQDAMRKIINLENGNPDFTIGCLEKWSNVVIRQSNKNGVEWAELLVRGNHMTNEEVLAALESFLVMYEHCLKKAGG